MMKPTKGGVSDFINGAKPRAADLDAFSRPFVFVPSATFGEDRGVAVSLLAMYR
jgi:hypothetical protein